MSKKITIQIIIIFFLVSCRAENRAGIQPLSTATLLPASTNTLPSHPTVVENLSAEQTIYAHVITEIFGALPTNVIEEKAGCLILEMQAEGYADYQKILTALQDDTLTDYVAKIETEKSLRQLFAGEDHFFVINEASYWLSATPEEGLLTCSGADSLSVEKLQKDFPDANGVLHLSPIGFSENGKQALVCLGLNQGGCTKEVEIVLLEKDVANWAIKGRFQIFSIP